VIWIDLLSFFDIARTKQNAVYKKLPSGLANLLVCFVVCFGAEKGVFFWML